MWHLVWIVIVLALLIGAITAIFKAVRVRSNQNPMRNELNRIDDRLSSIEKTLKDVDAE